MTDNQQDNSSVVVALWWRMLISILVGVILGLFVGDRIGFAYDSYQLRKYPTSLPGDSLLLPVGEICGWWLGILIGAALGVIGAYWWRKKVAMGRVSLP
jgi:uncharacterized protein YneF (UPF0154 family)